MTKLPLALLLIAATLSGTQSYSQQTDSLQNPYFLKFSYGNSIVKFPELNTYVQDYLLFKKNEGRSFPGGGPEITLCYSKSTNLMFEAGISYFFANTNLSRSTVGTTGRTVDYKLSGFKIPILLNYNLTERERRVMFHALGGMQILHANVTRTIISFSQTGNNTEIKESSVTQPTLVGGIGMNFRVLKGLKLFYNLYGASNIATTSSHVSIGLSIKIKPLKVVYDDNQAGSI